MPIKFTFAKNTELACINYFASQLSEAGF